jgi:hypothetical protein
MLLAQFQSHPLGPCTIITPTVKAALGCSAAACSTRPRVSFL